MKETILLERYGGTVLMMRTLNWSSLRGEPIKKGGDMGSNSRLRKIYL